MRMLTYVTFIFLLRVIGRGDCFYLLLKGCMIDFQWSWVIINSSLINTVLDP